MNQGVGASLFNKREEEEDMIEKKRLSDESKEELHRRMKEAQSQIDPSGYYQKSVYFQMSLIIQSLSLSQPQDNPLSLSYQLFLDTEWSLLQGSLKGLTQQSTTLSHANNQSIVFSLPVDFLLRTSKISTTPVLAFTLKGHDFLGRPIVKAYGSIHLPMFPGHHDLSLTMYRPIAFTWYQQWIDCLKGSSKEFNRIDYSVAQENAGTLSITMDTLSRNLTYLGYQANNNHF